MCERKAAGLAVVLSVLFGARPSVFQFSVMAQVGWTTAVVVCVKKWFHCCVIYAGKHKHRYMGLLKTS